MIWLLDRVVFEMQKKICIFSELVLNTDKIMFNISKMIRDTNLLV